MVCVQLASYTTVSRMGKRLDDCPSVSLPFYDGQEAGWMVSVQLASYINRQEAE